MSYSYSGWEDEFTGLTKENEFSGRPAPKPDGLGSKPRPTPRPRIIKDDEEDPTPTPTRRPDPVKEVIQEVVSNYAALSGGASLKEAFTGEGGLSVATAKPYDLTDDSKTALYLAQNDARQNNVLNYLAKYTNINIKKDVFNLPDDDRPDALAIFENSTKGSLVSRDDSLSITTPGGKTQTIYDNGFVRTNQPVIGSYKGRAVEIIDRDGNYVDPVTDFDIMEMRLSGEYPWSMTEDEKNNIHSFSMTDDEIRARSREEILKQSTPSMWEVFQEAIKTLFPGSASNIASSTPPYGTISGRSVERRGVIKDVAGKTSAQFRPAYKKYGGLGAGVVGDKMIDLGKSNIDATVPLFGTGANLKVGTSEGLGAPNSLNVGIENAEIGKTTLGANFDFATNNYGLDAAANVGGWTVGANYNNTEGANFTLNKDFWGGKANFSVTSGYGTPLAKLNFNFPLGR